MLMMTLIVSDDDNDCDSTKIVMVIKECEIVFPWVQFSSFFFLSVIGHPSSIIHSPIIAPPSRETREIDTEIHVQIERCVESNAR